MPIHDPITTALLVVQQYGPFKAIELGNCLVSIALAEMERALEARSEGDERIEQLKEIVIATRAIFHDAGSGWKIVDNFLSKDEKCALTAEAQNAITTRIPSSEARA